MKEHFQKSEGLDEGLRTELKQRVKEKRSGYGWATVSCDNVSAQRGKRNAFTLYRRAAAELGKECFWPGLKS